MLGHRRTIWLITLANSLFFTMAATAQPLGQPDRGEPGDEMIHAYLARETAKISARLADDVVSKSDWEAKRPLYLEQYFYMLGLSPRPERTPLAATVTGSLKGDGYVVDKIHYQSRAWAVRDGQPLPPGSGQGGSGQGG